MKSSKEFKSMPRMVTPAELMARSSPQSFSFGECKLTTMIECGSTRSTRGDCPNDDSSASGRGARGPVRQEYRAAARKSHGNRLEIGGNEELRFGDALPVLGAHSLRCLAEEQTLRRYFDDGHFRNDQVH